MYDLTKNMKNIVMKVCQKSNMQLESRISKLEADCHKQDQYNRRNNVEIPGIPSNISDDMLEENVIQIFEGIALS